MTREVGVAFAIPEPHHGELQRWRLRLGDPQAAAVPPHVTLLPPTPVEDDALPEAEEHLRRVAADGHPFVMHLRGSATFRPVSPVVFVPLVRGISDCERIERQVRSGPLAREVHFPYHPHVTVAHDVAEHLLDRAFDELAGYEAAFPVRGFTLFERGPDRVWRPHCDFPFAGAGPPGG